jgi:hypothetical protein
MYFGSENMANYDLDEKKGLFSRFNSLKPSKCFSIGDKILLKHYSEFNKYNTSILYYDDSIIRVQTDDEIDIVKVLEGDHVVLFLSKDKIEYSICGEIAAIDTYSPFKVDIKVDKIENMKDLRKYKHYFVSELGQIKVVGQSDKKNIIIKNISFGGVKFKLVDELNLDDRTDFLLRTEEVKFSFKGKIVRKNKKENFYEYGLELVEITESNLLMLHRYMNSFEFY